MSRQNYEAAVRALMTEKSLTYAQAKMLYDRKNNQFRNLVRKVIQLATNNLEEDAPSEELIDITQREARWGRSARERELVAFLDTVGDADLRKLEALMYFGRAGGDDDLPALHRELHFSDRNDTIGHMAEKWPLGRYLEEGLRLADERGVSVEGQWAAERHD